MMPNMTKQKNFIRRFTPWLMWGLGALAFFVEYLIRVAPASMVPNLIETFSASSLDISAFSAYFLYAYVLMQIPVGLLVDRFGPRLSLSLSTVLCAYSTFLFATTTSLYVAQFSRFLLGFGAAFALVGSLKIALMWFKPSFFSIIVGLSQALGMIGGAVGVYLISRLAELENWQTSLLFFAGFLAFLAFLIAVFVRDRAEFSAPQSTPLPLRTSFKIVFNNKQVWIIGIFSGLLYMPTAVIAELWGSFYLSTTQQISTATASNGISFIFIGWAIGGPLSGALSNQFGRRPIMKITAFLSFSLITLILYAPPLPLAILYGLLFFYGLSNSGVTAAYTAIVELNPPTVAGMALGFGNGMSVIIGAFCQQIIGALMDWFQSNSHPSQAIYSPEALKMAMSIVVIGSLLSFIVSFLTKETLPSKN
jgi:sugar phosphate permease